MRPDDHMNEGRPRPAARLTETEARRVLEMATERDAKYELVEEGVSIAELRGAAIEAGISAHAFDAALSELRSEHPRSRASSIVRRAFVGTMLGLAFAVGLVRLREPATTTPIPSVPAPTTAEACTPDGVDPQRLRALAAQHYPDALAKHNQSSSVVVGMLFDSQCSLTDHTVTHRAGDGLTVDTTLLRLFPSRYKGEFVVAGIADAGSVAGVVGSPWIVWGVLPPR